MRRTTQDGTETLLTYTQLVQEAIDVANGIVADCEDRGLAALFEEDLT